MKKSLFTMLISLSALSLGTTAQAAPAPGDDFAYTNEQFADIQMLRYKVEGFDQLTLRQKTLIYHLAEAAHHAPFAQLHPRRSHLSRALRSQRDEDAHQPKGRR